MRTYEKLDAWKSSHALVLAVHEATEKLKRDDELVYRLNYTSLRAAGKIAFGAGCGNRRMFLYAVQRSAGFLAEFGYYLSLARVMGVLTDQVWKRLDALRGRAAFYTWQLLESLTRVPPGEAKPG
jgi:hypothetical protein